MQRYIRKSNVYIRKSFHFARKDDFWWRTQGRRTLKFLVRYVFSSSYYIVVVAA